MRMLLRAVALVSAGCLLAACQVSLEREADPASSATAASGTQ